MENGKRKIKSDFIFRFPFSVKLSSSRLTAEERQNFASNIARIGVRSKENISRRDFFGLCGTFHRRIRAEFLNFLGGFIDNIKRCPNRTGRNARGAQQCIARGVLTGPSKGAYLDGAEGDPS